jgi:RNA polymerase sigma-70 factor (ECF subfamily)
MATRSEQKSAKIGAIAGRRGDRERLVRAAARIAPEDAEDAVQDAFVQALTSVDSFREEARASTWLYRVVVNAALMRRRRSKRVARYTRAATSCTADFPWATGGQRNEPPDDLLARREEVQQVRTAVRGLPSTYREAIEDWVLAERDPHDAANDLGITTSCLRTRVARARQQLAVRLKPAA